MQTGVVPGGGVAESTIGQIAGVASWKVEQIAKMDKVICGDPKIWPDKVFAQGAPVWVALPGLQHLGVMPGTIDYSNVHTDRNTMERSGYVGVVVEHELPVTGRITYSILHSGTFWPRTLELKADRPSLVEMIGD